MPQELHKIKNSPNSGVKTEININEELGGLSNEFREDMLYWTLYLFKTSLDTNSIKTREIDVIPEEYQVSPRVKRLYKSILKTYRIGYAFQKNHDKKQHTYSKSNGTLKKTLDQIERLDFAFKVGWISKSTYYRKRKILTTLNDK